MFRDHGQMQGRSWRDLHSTRTAQGWRLPISFYFRLSVTNNMWHEIRSWLRSSAASTPERRGPDHFRRPPDSQPPHSTQESQTQGAQRRLDLQLSLLHFEPQSRNRSLRSSNPEHILQASSAFSHPSTPTSKVVILSLGSALAIPMPSSSRQSLHDGHHRAMAHEPPQQVENS